MENLMLIDRDDLRAIFAEFAGEFVGNKKEYGKYLTRLELCELTGFKLNTINMKVCRKEIPGMRKIGGKSLFETETILKWIESGAVKTRSEVLDDLEKGGSK
ncbi:MAG: hypothetical protein RSB69_11925 [Odoribacter sp.]